MRAGAGSGYETSLPSKLGCFDLSVSSALQPPPSSALPPPCLPPSFHTRTGTFRDTNSSLPHTGTTSGQKLFHHQCVLKIDHRYSPPGAVVLPLLAPTTSSPCFHPPPPPSTPSPPLPSTPTPPPPTPLPHAHTRGRNRPL